MLVEEIEERDNCYEMLVRSEDWKNWKHRSALDCISNLEHLIVQLVCTLGQMSVNVGPDVPR